MNPETGEAIVNYLKFGDFISAVISFFILAVVIFLMIKGMNALRSLDKRKKEEPAPEPDPEPSNEEKLLTEIRDLLKQK